MNIKFKGQYKAVKDFEWKDIPSLAILTGFNGTGKTQVLQLVLSAYSSLSNSNLNNNIFKQPEYSITIENVEFSQRGAIQWQSQGGYFSFEQYKFGYKDLEKILEVILNWIQGGGNTDLINNSQNLDANQEQQDYNQGFNRLKYVLQQKREKIISELLRRSGKRKEDILAEDILFFLPEDVFSEDSDLISQDNLDMVFFLYLYRKVSLEKNGLDIEKLGDAPWEILNKVIRNAGLPYELAIPNEEPISALFRNPLNRLSPYQFSAKLINPDNGLEIGIQNLSSGERIIMSLAMLLYYFQFRGLKKSLLILDEVDAHLHPSLTKQFFDVVNNVIIGEYGARVFMATHSPSTVALAPVDTLFILTKNENSTSIEAVQKDKALTILTTGVPSISINYENRKQIFVESKYDAEYYDTLFKHLKEKLNQEISLDFISSGVSGRGNCTQVLEVVTKLNELGNKSIYGIIDWDNKNLPVGNTKVLGENKRYSIENYIFDPILLGYYLLRQKIKSSSELGLEEGIRFLDYHRLSSEQIQIVSDRVLELIKVNIKGELKSSLKEVEYISGMKIMIPEWFLFCQGHTISDMLFKTFPALLKYKDENGLRGEIIKNTVKDIPEFISIDIYDLFADIQCLN